jgi:outer membrane receptor protein involved in Fe transport
MKLTKRIIIFTILFLVNSVVASPAEEGGRKANKEPHGFRGFRVEGKIIEKGSKAALEYASISLFDNHNKLISGTITDQNGEFELKSKSSEIYIKVDFLGFSSKIIKEFKIGRGEIDFGEINLEQDSKNIGEVVVRAERSKTEFKLDRRVFNIGQDIASSGISALEALNNVPSVNVNIEGVISLRGNTGVKMLINGKPSVLADEESNSLGTITADMIESIEVITNPSAKYDASGTSGIINIILKKNEKEGMNGSLTLNTGIPNNHSGGFSMNYRTGNFNLFSQLGAGYRTFEMSKDNINKDLVSKRTIESVEDGKKNEQFYNITLGADYFINSLNTITLKGNYAYEIETQPNEIKYKEFQNSSLNNSWTRNEETDATNPKYEYELNYKKVFKNNEEHNLVISALGDLFAKEKESNFSNSSSNEDQKVNTDFKALTQTYKVDYTNPISKDIEFEAGSQYEISDISNDYKVQNFTDNKWEVDNNQTNNFEMLQKVFGLYSTLGYEFGNWGVKAGVRLENTDLGTELTNTTEINNRNYTDWFPSIHTSYNINKFYSLQAGYSRRIHRPRLWHLNPFFNITNTYNVRTGNPDLNPEYTDSYELTGIFQMENLSFSSSIYNKYTTDVIENFSTFKDNINYSSPQNIGTNNSLGFEINGKYTPTKWLSFNGDFNILSYKREGNYNNKDYDVSSSRWFSKLTSKLKLPAHYDLELTGNYQSKFKSLQSTVSSNYFVDLGLRKKMLNGRAIVSLSVRDLFATRRNKNIINTPQYYTYANRERSPSFVIGFSWGFGKGEAMEFGGEKRF